MAKSPKHPLAGRVLNAALVGLAFALLGKVIWDNREPMAEVFHRNLDGRLISLAIAISMVGLMAPFLRWFWLVRVIEPSFRLRDAFLLGFIGDVFNLVIPGAVGGDLIKAAYLVRMRINKTEAIASMVLDRILGILGLFLLAAISGGFAWSMAGTPVRRPILVVWFLAATGLLGLAVVFSRVLTRAFPGLLAGHGRISLLLTELTAMSRAYRRRPEVVVGALAMSVVTHTLNVMAFYTISSTLFPSRLPSLAQHFLMVPLTLFTTAVPLPFGALGLSEQVGEQLFKLVAHPHGALAMMSFRVLMYGGGVVSACVYLANLRQVRALTATVEHLEDELRAAEIGTGGGEEPGPDDTGTHLEGAANSWPHRPIRAGMAWAGRTAVSRRSCNARTWSWIQGRSSSSGQSSPRCPGLMRGGRLFLGL